MGDVRANRDWPGTVRQPILRAPPFPGAKIRAVSRLRGRRAGEDLAAAEKCIDAIRSARVGGDFWAAQPDLPATITIIARPGSPESAAAMIARAAKEKGSNAVLLWFPSVAAARQFASCDLPRIGGLCDPWHLIDHADEFWLDADDEIALLASIAGKTVHLFGQGRFSRLSADPSLSDGGLRALASEYLIEGSSYIDPFTAADGDALSTVALLGFWRALIDANRPIVAAAGFAFWKRPTVEALLWNGSEPVRFIGASRAALETVPAGRAIAVWKARVDPDFLDALDHGGAPVHEVEDGFIRSSGLGADCVPPLSIVADRLGVHFDPGRPSELEELLQLGSFPAELLERAAGLRALILDAGISKYGAGQEVLDRPGGARRHVLVTGQVEDDRSVLFGGGAVKGNLDLLRRARACEPDAFIIYKPHPDVEAGHRKGHVPEAAALQYADAIIRDASISSLLAMVDGVHVLTSLAGFEALIRGKPVTVHGTPFYAGWGLTHDLGEIPARRTARRTMEELMAAVLLLYPRYIDPVTKLPCPPEILLSRLIGGGSEQNSVIILLRRLQGGLRRTIERIGAGR